MRSIYQFYTRTEEGTVIPSAEITVNFSGGGEAPIFTQESGGTAVTQPIIASISGKTVFYVEPGVYDIVAKDPITSLTSSFNSEEIGLAMGDLFSDQSKTIKLKTTQDLIFLELDTPPSIGAVAETLGDSSVGDGASAQWQFNGVTGQTPSQSQSDLGAMMVNDADGNQWDMVSTPSIPVDEFPATGIPGVLYYKVGA